MTKELYQKIDTKTFGPWAVVTGASSGIGEQFARQLAANNINLILVARRQGSLKRLGDELKKQYGISYYAVQADLSQEDFLSKITKVTNKLEVGLVVSNAGVGATQRFLDTQPEELSSRTHTNVSAHIILAHHFGTLMAQRGRGGLLFVSSIVGLQGVPYMADYGAAKAYILSLAEALHTELKPAGVHVTALLPGPVNTPMLEDLGLTGSSSMKPLAPDQCAMAGLKAIDKNSTTYIPGIASKVISKLPRSTVTRVLGDMNSKVLVDQHTVTDK